MVVQVPKDETSQVAQEGAKVELKDLYLCIKHNKLFRKKENETALLH